MIRLPPNPGLRFCVAPTQNRKPPQKRQRRFSLEAAIFSDDQEVTEVTVTELAQRASAVIERVSSPSNERVIVTKHGRPVAVIVSLAVGYEVMLAGSERFTMLRREAREELEAGVAEALTAWRIRTKSF